jgi:two-component system response regulator YesN
MYRILIADDEPEVLESIYETLTEAEFENLDIIKAGSGREAAALINQTKIDILLTDIKMPGVNGIELAETAKRNWPRSRVIFLTGYYDTDYMYGAIKSDCCDYLLKTESSAEIIKAVRKAAAETDRSYHDEEITAKAREHMKSILPQLQNRYMLNIAEEPAARTEISQSQLDELEIGLDCGRVIYLLAGSIDAAPEGGSGWSYRSRVMQAVKLITEEAFSKHFNQAFVQAGLASFLCLIQEKPDSAAFPLPLLNGTIETLQSVYRRSLEISVSFILGNRPVSWDALSQKYSELKHMLSFSAGIGEEVFFTDESFSRVLSEKKHFLSDGGEAADGIANARNLGALANALEHGMKDEYDRQLSAVTGGFSQIKSMHNTEALEIYYSVSNRLLSYINRWKLADRLPFKIGLYKLTRADMHDSWKDAADYLSALSDEIFSVRKQDQNEIAAVPIDYVRRYIQNHLDEDLSLIRLAELVYFNPSYLSRLFKQMTGVNLSEFIIREKIEKTKYLLLETDLKIFEIAQKVGLDSATYLGRLFKKYTDMTPKAFRESNFKRM